MKRKVARRTSQSEQIEALLLGQDILDRVDKGLVHLRKLNLASKVGVCEEDTCSGNDEAFLKRLGLRSVDEAISLGFSARNKREEGFLKKRWRQVLRKR